jgi:8-oxo-dGTP pyrophosphatase MutT (NUDIX family)
MPRPLAAVLADHVPGSDAEARDLARMRALAAGDRPWSRDEPVHATASAIVVHPPTGRVLLRWHERMQSWLTVGGHGDPGEDAPLAVARREAEEETGLADLVPWPARGGGGEDGGAADPGPIHLAVVAVPAGNGEPAHEHADLRFVLATDRPDDAVPERPGAPLRWLPVAEAAAAVSEDNVRVTLDRVARLLAPATDP